MGGQVADVGGCEACGPERLLHADAHGFAVVLLTYPREAVGGCNALKAFLCSDLSLSDEEVLEHYSHRWKIEVMFKQQKRYLGLKSFMIRSAKAIDRFLIILTLAWFWFTWQAGSVLPFSAGIRRYRGALSIF